MADSNMIRVLTVDDHALVRKGIRYTLLSVEDIELVGEANSGEEALIVCAEQEPDVVIMDMRMEGDMDGITATRAIHDRHPKTQVVALSSYFNQDLVQGVMQAGAISYLVKGSSGEELVAAIRAAHSGRSTLANEAVQALIQEGEKPSTLGNDLTEQEHMVLALLVEGLTNPQIAEHQNYSVAAVKYHVSNILSKLGAANRTEAVALAVENNLVPKV
jgi:NarL family two-component system response regulator LiaR